MDLSKLREPFAAQDVEWRIAQAGVKKDGKPWAKVLAYITNRAVQDRLDLVCGPDHWCNEYKAGPAGGVCCGICILIQVDPKFDSCRPVTKWDGAENSDIEGVKGGLSDSMKRAAVQWGIGRYLYDLGESWAVISDGGSKHSKVKIDGKDVWINWDPPKLPVWALPDARTPISVATANPANVTIIRPASETAAKCADLEVAATSQFAAVAGQLFDGTVKEPSAKFTAAIKAIGECKDKFVLERIAKTTEKFAKDGTLSQAEVIEVRKLQDIKGLSFQEHAGV